MKQRRKIVAIFLVSIIFLGSIIYFGNRAEAVTEVKTAKITNSATALATTVIRCPGITSVASCTSDNGTTPVYSISGDDVTVTCNNGTGSPNYTYNITLTYEVTPFIDVKITYDKLEESNNSYSWSYNQTTTSSVNVDRAYNIAPETNAFYPNNFKVDVEGAGWGGTIPSVTIADKNGNEANPYILGAERLHQSVKIESVKDSFSVQKFTITATCNGMTKTLTVNSAYINTNTAAAAHWDRVGFVVTSINGQIITGTQGEKTVDAPNGTISAAGITTLNNLIKATGLIASSYEIKGYWKIKCWLNDAGGNPYGVKYYYLRSELLPEVAYDVDQLGDDCINSFTNWSPTTRNTFDALDPFVMTYKGLVIGVLNRTIIDTDGNSIPGNPSSQITVPFDPATIYNYTAVAPIISGYTLQTGTLQDKDNNPAVTNGSSARSINYTNENQSANIQWVYKKNYIPPANQPPVPIIDLQETCIAGDTVRLRGTQSYDTDGTIVKYDWLIQGSPSDMEEKSSGSITFPAPGEFIVMLDVTDDDGATSSTSVRITVTVRPPSARFTYTGMLKENRKVTFDGGASIPGTYTLDWSRTSWMMSALTGGLNTDADIKFTSTAGQKVISGLYKKEGKYPVGIRIYDSTGLTSTYNETITIAPDLAPVANFSVPAQARRDPAKGNIAVVTCTNYSASNDGDAIRTVWFTAYDSDNDGDKTDETWYYSLDGTNWVLTGLPYSQLVTNFDLQGKAVGNPATCTVNSPQVGKRYFELMTIDVIPAADTIPALLTSSDYKRDNTFVKKLASEKVCDVINTPPTANITAVSYKKLDIVVATDYNTTKQADLDAKLNLLKYNLLTRGYDANYYFTNKASAYGAGHFVSQITDFDSNWSLPYSISGPSSITSLYGTNTLALQASASSTSIAATFPLNNTSSEDAILTVKGSGTFTLDGLQMPGTYTTVAGQSQYVYTSNISSGNHTLIALSQAAWHPPHHRKDEDYDGYWSYSPTYVDSVSFESPQGAYVDTKFSQDNAIVKTVTSVGNATLSLFKDGRISSTGAGISGIVPFTNPGWKSAVDIATVPRPFTPVDIYAVNSAFFYLTKEGTLWATGNSNWTPHGFDPSTSGWDWTPFTGYYVYAYNVKKVVCSNGAYAVLTRDGNVYMGAALNGRYYYGSRSVHTYGSLNLPETAHPLPHSGGITADISADGLNYVSGLSGITDVAIYDSLLIAYNGNMKKTYCFGANPNGNVGWSTPGTVEYVGFLTNIVPDSVRTPTEMTALAGLDIQDINVYNRQVMTKNGDVYNFTRGYVYNVRNGKGWALSAGISVGNGLYDQHPITKYGTSLEQSTLAFKGFPFYTSNMYSLRMNDVKGINFRQGSKKVLLYAADGVGGSHWGDFGTYFPMLDIDASTKSFLEANGFDNYVVADPSTYTYQDYEYSSSQEFTLKDLFGNMEVKYYGPSAYDTALSAILANYNNPQSPAKIYLIAGEDTVNYNTTYADFENDPKQGDRWKYDQDSTCFENGNGLAAFSGQWRSTGVTIFDKLGKYVLTYQAQDNPLNIPSFNPYWLWSTGTNQIEIYVHRRPIANFIVGGSLEKQIVGSFLNDADGTSSLPVSLTGSTAAQGGIGLNGSSAYRVLPGTWQNYTGGSLASTFTIPASALNAKVGFYLMGNTGVTIDGVGQLATGLNQSSFTYFEYPLSVGTHTLKINAVHSSYHHKDDDWEVYGWFTMDDISVSYNTMYKDLTYRSKSYDLDHTSLSSRGIIAEEWKWKYPWEDNWRDGRPSIVEINIPFYVSLRVQDMENTWSYPVIQMVDYSYIKSLPVAQFNILKNPIETSELLKLTDTSYPIKGSLNAWQWVIYKLDENGYISAKVQDEIYYSHNNGMGALTGYDGNVRTDYNTLGKGTYRIFLRVKDTQGWWSDDGTDGSYDLNGCYYQDLVVRNSMMLLNFRVSMIRDLFLEGYYKDIAGPNKVYNDVDLNVNSMCIDKGTFTGMRGVKEGFEGLTKGYSFEFEIDSKGFNTSDAAVEFIPSFYTISDGGTRSAKPVEVYWKDSKNAFWKAGEGGHGQWKTVLLTAENRKITGDGTATWRGSYLVPASAFAVPSGTTEAMAKVLYYGNGYIKEDLIVDFQINGLMKGERKIDYNVSRWEVERMSPKKSYVVGDVIRYDWRSNCLHQIKTRRIF